MNILEYFRLLVGHLNALNPLPNPKRLKARSGWATISAISSNSLLLETLSFSEYQQDLPSPFHFVNAPLLSSYLETSEVPTPCRKALKH